ncbi:hypothetical protein [Phytohabitans rumicis]|uniref:Uncharacterized protein n=1 Tax=Phytohabitans rumicis TaxID=1076125 RepID=A0A6V8LCM4_9ACTN|nr:hypothetical protein [Phytohabitans rumicis]GFJ93420.1 hypothetical protein Prum_070620 [Phytohabitans rumicis]
MPVDDDHSAQLDVTALMEMTHETMMARWQQGLVTPMSPTISTFAKTDGSWWTASQVTWLRVSLAERNERLDFHHDRFESIDQAKGPATTARTSPWDKRPPQSLFNSQAPQLPGIS